jgi:hypothetical protein
MLVHYRTNCAAFFTFYPDPNQAFGSKNYNTHKSMRPLARHLRMLRARVMFNNIALRHYGDTGQTLRKVTIKYLERSAIRLMAKRSVRSRLQ